jgi:hypothetical protein
MRRFHRRAVLNILLLTPLALAGARAVQAQAVQPLRDVDWRAVLASEPGVSFVDDPACGDVVNQDGACVSVHFPDLQVTHIALPGESQLEVGDSVIGKALIGTGGPLYGDLDGDGRDEAAITVFNDRAFTVACFVYHEAPGRPRLVDAAPGYRMDVALQNGALLVTRPYYFGAPTVLGPTGISTTTYRIQDNLLRPEAPSTFVAYPVTPDGQDSNGNSYPASVSSYPEFIVLAFYRALGQRRFEAAYAFFSPSMQARTPFEAWRDGYASTVSFTLQTSYVPDPNNQGGDTFGSPDVIITLTTVDAQPGGGTVTRVFTGSWTLVEDQSTAFGLALDHANLRLVP